MIKEKQYYNEIKEILINNEINKKVKYYSKNKVELESYYNVGKMLFEAGKHYGEGIVKEYSIKLTKEVGKKYNVRYLYDIRKFYSIFSKQKVPPLGALSWSHYRILIAIKNENERNYYLKIVSDNNLTKRKLQEMIKNNEYITLYSTDKRIKAIEYELI